MQVSEVNVLKVAIANLMDADFGSTKGWTYEREVPMLMEKLSISKAMAVIILEACDCVREANAFDLI